MTGTRGRVYCAWWDYRENRVVLIPEGRDAAAILLGHADYEDGFLGRFTPMTKRIDIQRRIEEVHREYRYRDVRKRIAKDLAHAQVAIGLK